MKQNVILLMGPTASGKTDIAISLFKKIPSNIISVDSAMVYRGMNIGTVHVVLLKSTRYSQV